MNARTPLLVAALTLVSPGALLAQLSATGNQALVQGQGGLASAPGAGESFGVGLATGDFDGDGFADLAVGVPGQTVSGFVRAGSVHVIFGSRAGLTGARDVVLSQATSGVPGAAESEDYFGSALAAMDFNCDGVDDLAVGAPGEWVGALAGAAGAVWVFNGVSGSGLSASSAVAFDQDAWSGESAEGDDRFGSSLVGVSNGSNSAPVRKLYIGAQSEIVTFGGSRGQFGQGEGTVLSLRNKCDGAGFLPVNRLTQDSSGISTSVGRDRFGASLGRGDFDGDGVDDLVIGATSETVSGEGDAGAVHVLGGTVEGLWTGSTESFWHLDQSGVLGTADSYSEFGNAVAAGDFNRDGKDDLVVAEFPGSTHVLYGSSTGLSASGDQLFAHEETFGSTFLGGTGPQSYGVGDFDGDGVDDLAIGLGSACRPGEDYTGALEVIYGRLAFGLDPEVRQRFDQTSAGFLGGAEADDRFGSKLAVGDFNGDGKDDVAVGVPGEDVDGLSNTGLVQVVYGASNGILGEVEFAQVGPTTVDEIAQTATLTVRRQGPTNLAVTVRHQLKVASTSATLGADFQYQAGTLSWAAGDGGDKTITFSVLDDAITEKDPEFLTVELVDISSGTRLSFPSTRRVTIRDNDL